MISRYPYKGGVWVKLDRPAKEEIKHIMDEYGIDPLIAHELTTPTPRPKVELRQGYIYCIMHFPAFKHTHRIGNENQEIDFIIGKDYVITTQYDTIDAIHRLEKVLEVDEILNRGTYDSSAGFVFFRIMQEMYRSLGDEIAYIEDWIQEIQGRIFKGKEREMVVALSEVSRDLLDFKRVTNIHRDVLNGLEIAGSKAFGEHFVFHVKTLMTEYYKLHNMIGSNRDSVQELRDTNNSLLETKQNEVMKVLTMLAFMTLPSSLIAAIFSMNTSFIPLAGAVGDFWIVIGFMITVSLCIFAVFKYKKWI